MSATVANLTAVDVLEWLAENHPEQAMVAELDRAWVWLPVDLRGDHNRELREDLKGFGFKYAKHGHPLPSGATGTWAHHCDRPMPFKRRGGGKSSNEPDWARIAQESGLSIAEVKAAIA